MLRCFLGTQGWTAAHCAGGRSQAPNPWLSLLQPTFCGEDCSNCSAHIKPARRQSACDGGLWWSRIVMTSYCAFILLAPLDANPPVSCSPPPTDNMQRYGRNTHAPILSLQVGRDGRGCFNRGLPLYLHTMHAR